MDKTKNTTLPFVKTSDAETAELLKAEGLELVDENNGVWTFLNCSGKGANFDGKKVAYSNKLCF